MFLNGHGGNSSLLNVACRELRLRYGLMTFLAHPFVPPDQGGKAETDPADERGMGVHGGIDETSLILHLRPELVDMDAAFRNVPEPLADNTYVKFGGQVSFGWLSHDFGPSGHIGDPTGATAERGKALFEAAVAAVGAAARRGAGLLTSRALMQSSHPDLRVDGARLLRRIEALAEIGPIDGGGNNRLALTDADKDGRDLVVTWMRDLGLEVGIDEIGNVIATRAGREDRPARS